MRLGVRFRDGDAPGHACFGAGAVASGKVERHTVADADLRPGKEAMELPLWLTPEANIDHAIGRAAPGAAPGWIVPDKHGLRLSMGRIAEKVFDVEALRFAGLGVVGREGMPPPVVAFFRQRAFEHVGVACDVAFVHIASSFGECRLRGADSYFPVYAIIRVLQRKSLFSETHFLRSKTSFLALLTSSRNWDADFCHKFFHVVGETIINHGNFSRKPADI